MGKMYKNLSEVFFLRGAHERISHTHDTHDLSFIVGGVFLEVIIMASSC